MSESTSGAVKNMLQSILTDELALLYSWRGTVKWHAQILMSVKLINGMVII